MDNQGNPLDCRILDFQLTRYSPPGIDILYYLYATNSQKERQLIYSECLNYYYETLKDCLKHHGLSPELISRSDFEEDCLKSRFIALILWAICTPLMKMPEGLSNKWRAEDPKQYDVYMNKDRSEMFTRISDMSEDYAREIMIPIEELLDYVMSNEEMLVLQ